MGAALRADPLVPRLIVFMSRNRVIGFCFALFAAVSTLLGQTNYSTNTFSFTITPPTGKILVTDTTNTISVLISAYGTFTNAFTNVNVKGTYFTKTINFNDLGTPPDQTAGDGAFTGSLITPLIYLTTTNLTLTVIASADDLTMTNEPAPGEVNYPTVFVTNSVTYLIVPRPYNDAFTNAVKLAGPGILLITSTNNYGSLERGEPAPAGLAAAASSVWWRWSPQTSTNVLIDTAGSDFNTVLAVYTGTAVTNLSPVASAAFDKTLNLKAHVNFNALLGTTYHIAVAGATTNDEGNIRLRIVPGGLPDTNGPVATILSPANNQLFTTNLVDFSGTAADVNFDGSGVTKVFLQVNKQPVVAAKGAASWSVRLDLPPGTNTITAYAVDFAGNSGPPASITIPFVNPTNDMFSSAIRLAGLSGAVSAINGRATKEPGEPLHALNDGGHSIWYTWLAPANGLLSLTTTNSSFDTLLAVYLGGTISSLTPVAYNDDATLGSLYSALSARVKAGQLYDIAVDGYGGDSGNVQLAYQFTPTADFFDLIITEPMGGTESPGTGQYLANTNVSVTASPGPNFEFVGWTGSLNSIDNPLLVALTNSVTLTALFRPTVFVDDFETGDLKKLPWSFGGTTPWTVQSNNVYSGQFAARSGIIGGSQRSSLVLTTNTLAGSGFFDLFVSSEPAFDNLEFYLNGLLLKRWSGEVGWTSFQFAVPTGTNTFEWRYQKDSDFDEGLDAAFIDNVYLPLLSTVSTNTPAALSIQVLSSGQPQITLTGQGSQPYTVQASTNLLNWLPVSTNQMVNGQSQFIDEPIRNWTMRFYRAVAP